MGPSIPRGLTPAARLARDEFFALYKDHCSKVSEVALNILIWGQSPSRQTAVARKRLEIKEQLIDDGHNAMFSEDIPTPRELSQKTAEFEQAKLADLIVILIEESPGALAEAHDFCNHSELAPKLLLMCPRKYLSGYSAKGGLRLLERAHNGVHWYRESELGSCNVMKRARVRAQAIRELRHIGFARKSR